MLFNNNTDTLTVAAVVQLPTDKTRRKRLKVVSACSECRRKKTKCNGEKPCAGCIKTSMDCKYSNSPKTKVNNTTNNRPITSTNPTNNTTNPTTTTNISNNNNNFQRNIHVESSNSTNSNASATIHAIENRLSVIEDILKILLLSTNQTEGRNSAFLPQHQQQQQQQQQQQRNMQVHSGPYYGEMYHSSSSLPPPQPQHQHQQHQQQEYYRSLNKRRHSDDDDDDSYYSATSPIIVPQQSSDVLVRGAQPVTYNHNVRLPPPLNYQPTLSESSSTSTTSSICSSTSSPKINTIQTLLNNVKQEEFKYTRPSAFSTVEVANRSY
ncbi:uncharacterized protein EV154DRAFT_494277 [Mucor mucedo]|uniref:uncharacterized protein n=1 Tax=Mucor mucedo TaxID=29922 RepID=UPI00221F5B5B|nr:uncharacterized protein EV154DRAFT_494277 [Mucor mucedo]KAI7895939.1 hypothetical protein EV154DRAFT_494277 [Mucor mucedo]